MHILRNPNPFYLVNTNIIYRYVSSLLVTAKALIVRSNS